MIREDGSPKREFREIALKSDLVVAGGGLSGVCCAITAARQGLSVILVQDRPVLGGNSSSEVRLWVLGATSHMGNNNRWAREGGVIDEILVENMYRNPEGNAVIFDTVVLDKVVSEPNITLLLNTAATDVEKADPDHISAVQAFCSQNSTRYRMVAPLFCDATGDGALGFLAGAAFRMGAESREEFGEKFAPTTEYGELLGHSIYFYTKDTGKPVSYTPPSYALDDITKIPRFKKFSAKEQGCQLWWIEYGGRLDTVHDTETIKWELWRVVYGVWNYIKNSGHFPEAKNLTLEWVGTIPGKRESRRFEGDYILRQQDIVEQRTHADAVSFGGWSIDLHPADGVFSEKPGCNQWHSKGIYQIPFRCLYSRNIRNLFLGGRIMSASHVAFGSSRVMGTCANNGQAIGMAAVLCKKHNTLPSDLVRNHIEELQQQLLRFGQYIPGHTFNDDRNLVRQAAITATSELALTELPEAGLLKPLDPAVAQLIPMEQGSVPEFTVHANTSTYTNLEVALSLSSREGNFTPEILLEEIVIPLSPGRNCIPLRFRTALPKSTYAFLIFKKNPEIQMHFSLRRVTGLLSVFNHINPAVSNFGKQTPTEDIGVETFEFWCPQRRPEGQNVAIKFKNPLKCFGAENIRNGIARPVDAPNAWVADFSDTKPSISLSWKDPQTIREIVLKFDTDYDHPMESVLMGHPERVMPFCVRNYSIVADGDRVVWEGKDNYQTINKILFDTAVTTRTLTVNVEHPSTDTPAAIFEILCF